jgi:hypothetical protein
MNLDGLRTKLPSKFSVTLTNISEHTYKLNIYDGTTAKYIGVISDKTLTTTYDAGYEDCVKGWIEELFKQ